MFTAQPHDQARVPNVPRYGDRRTTQRYFAVSPSGVPARAWPMSHAADVAPAASRGNLEQTGVATTRRGRWRDLAD